MIILGLLLWLLLLLLLLLLFLFLCCCFLFQHNRVIRHSEAAFITLAPMGLEPKRQRMLGGFSH